MKIIQLTDLHIRSDDDCNHHGLHVDTRNNCLSAFRDAARRHPDAAAWVLSGDLVDDESATGYQWLNEQLPAVSPAVFALPGNHDDMAAMQAHLTHARICEHAALNGWHLYFLDSQIAGTAAGALDAATLDWLDSSLSNRSEPSIVFVHHPPISVGSRWLDAIGMTNGAALRHVVARHPQVAAVSCGHAHQHFDTQIGRVRYWVTPATAFQFLALSDKFALDRNAPPGYRVIQLDDTGGVTSHIERMP